MEYQLRKYQQEAVDLAVEYFEGDNDFHSLIVLPTGSGKSLVIANIAKRLNGHILILQPTKEILQQNIDKLRSYGFEASIYSASFKSKEISKITYATIGSIKNRPDLFKHFEYIILDEGHVANAKGGMYKEFFDNIGKIKVLFLTATPIRLSTDGFGGSILKFLTRTRPRIVSKLLYYVQTGDLAAEGYWCPIDYYDIKGFDRSRLKSNSTGADFDEQVLKAYYEQIGFSNRVIKVVERLIEIERKGILVFTSFIADSEYLCSKIPAAEMVSSKTPPKERDKIIQDFRDGKTKVIFNTGILSVGFDYPELDTVVLARPTKSLVVYYQQSGRLCRPHPSKEKAMLVDMVENVKTFGKIEDLRIRDTGNEKWIIESNGRQLTNVYL